MYRDHDHIGPSARAPERSSPGFSGDGADGRDATVAAGGESVRPEESAMACLHSPAALPRRTPAGGSTPDLVALTDLKWLMSAYVERIDIPRLLREPAYARRCLDVARATPSEMVQRVAARVLSPLL